MRVGCTAGSVRSCEPETLAPSVVTSGTSHLKDHNTQERLEYALNIFACEEVAKLNRCLYFAKGCSSDRWEVAVVMRMMADIRREVAGITGEDEEGASRLRDSYLSSSFE